MLFKNVLKNLAVLSLLTYAAIAANGCAAKPYLRESTVSLSRPSGFFCTGVAVGKHMVLTNKHCLDDETVILYNGKSCPTDKMIAFDGTDNVLVRTCQTYKHWRKITHRAPREGDRVKHYGHPYGLPLMYREGVHILTAEATTLWPTAPMGIVYIFDMNATHGDSGGPVYAANGEVLCTVSFGLHMPGDGFQVMACYPPKFTKKQLKEIK